MFVIVEKCYDLITLNYKIRRISSIRIDALMELFRNTSHYADMIADMAFISSESLSLRLCTSAERVLDCVHLPNVFETVNICRTCLRLCTSSERV